MKILGNMTQQQDKVKAMTLNDGIKLLKQKQQSFMKDFQVVLNKQLKDTIDELDFESGISAFQVNNIFTQVVKNSTDALLKV